ncbi:IclR family transcriptional regulator [Lactobacillus delbrueckii]|uniref:IclR family transcriptional regulator n=1 Tax=Lactobacillus delbrueckii TaxID=1584 RepID=UPI00399100CA
MHQYLLSTLVKADQVLRLASGQGSVSLKEVMDLLQLKKTTAFRLLYTLTDLGYLSRVGQKYYPQLPQRPDQMLNWTAVPLLREIAGKYDLSCYVGILYDQEVVITQVVPAKSHPEDLNRLGEQLPLNTSAMGKCILAFSDDQTRDRLLTTQPFSARTPYTLVGGDMLATNIEIIAEQGYALDDEEKELAFRCLSVPVLKDGQLVAALGISGKEEELVRRSFKTLAKELTHASHEIVNRLL